MDLKFIKRVPVFFSLIFPMSLTPYLSYAQDSILCPSVNEIKITYLKLDSAQKINNKYITYTATSVFQSNDLWWFVGVGDIMANSSEEAIKIGKNVLKDANLQFDVYATKSGNEYICNYGPGYIQARGKNFA